MDKWKENRNVGLLIIVFSLLFSFLSYSQDRATILHYINLAEDVYDASPDSSFKLCCLAEEKAKEINTDEFIGDIAYCKGRYYILMTEYGKSGEELNKAIMFYEKEGNLDLLASTYSLLSILSERIGDSEAAHTTLLKAYEIDKRIENEAGQINTLSNLVLDFLNPMGLDSALYYLQQLDALKSKMEGTSVYYYYQNWGTYHYLNGDYPKAIKFQKQALHLANLYNMLDSKATIQMSLAQVYLANDQIDEATEMANASYNLSAENNLIYEKSEALEQLVAIAELTGDYKAAYRYQQELSLIEKEIYNLEKVRKAKEMEGQLSLAQKEKIIAEQELSIKEEKLEASRVRSQNLLLYFIVLIAVILVFFILWIYIKTKRLNVSIKEQKEIIQEKSEVLEDAFKNINDSLEYSKYIQRAMLPSMEFFKNRFKDFFILFKPKDIVSGDFYWATELDGIAYFAAADCTGHGVPGAMVSIIGFNGLNRCVRELHLTRPADILNSLSDFVEEALANEEKEIKDGMDIALCAYNPETKMLTYAGANNPVYIVSDGVLAEYKANKQPVGKFHGRKEFTEEQIILREGDSVYLFTDGYADQFGGDRGKKLKYKAFKHIITSHSMDDMAVQESMIERRFEEWKGDLEQIDDVCVIGIRI